MNFLILSRLPSIYSTQRLVQEIKNLGHNAFVENPESPCEGLSVDVLIPRLGNFRYPQSMENLKHLQESKKPRVILNASPFFEKARHKKRAYELLAELPKPEIYEEAPFLPIVVKDCLSSQGEGVFLCRTPEELKNCLYKLQGREVLFQEFIAESQGHDVRVFVVGSRVIAAMERVSQDPTLEFRSNISLGGHSMPVTLSKPEEEISLRAVQLLGLNYAGVDLIRSNRGPLILEVNPCPGFEGLEKCSQKNIAKEVVLYAESSFHSYSER